MQGELLSRQTAGRLEVNFGSEGGAGGTASEGAVGLTGLGALGNWLGIAWKPSVVVL